jgi:hypothetical protein
MKKGFWGGRFYKAHRYWHTTWTYLSSKENIDVSHAALTYNPHAVTKAQL